MTYSADVLAHSPLGYYRLGEATPAVTPSAASTLVDSSGNGHDGTYKSTTVTGGTPVTSVTGYVAGDSDMAMDFRTSGSGERATAEVPDASWLDQAAFTCLATVVRPSGSAVRTIMARYDSGFGGTFTVSSFAFRVEASGKLAVYIFTGGSYTAAIGSTTLTPGTTYDVAATYDGTTAKVYVNGVLDGSATVSGMNNASRPLSIGGTSGAPYEQFGGPIDEAAYFGSALSAANLLALHTSRTTLPPPGDPDNLTATPDVDQLEFEWTNAAGTDLTDGFDVRIDGGTPVDVGDVFTHTFTGLDPLTTYLLEVRAYNNTSGDSGWSSLSAETLDEPYEDTPYAALVRVGSHYWDLEAGDPADLEGPEVLAGATFAWSAPDTIGWPPPMWLVPRDVVRLKIRCPQAEEVADVRRGDVVRFRFTPEGYTLSDPLVDFAGLVTADPQISDDPAGGVFLTVTASDYRVIFADWTLTTSGTTHIGDGGDTKEVLLQNLSAILDTQAAAHLPGDFGDVTAGAVDPYEHLGYNLGIADLEYTGAVTALKVLIDIGIMPVPRYDPATGDLDPDQPFAIEEVDYFGRDFDTPDPVPASLVPNLSVDWRRDFTTTYVQVLEDLLGLPFDQWQGAALGAPTPTDLRTEVVTRVQKLNGFQTNGLTNEVPEPSPWTLFSFIVRAWAAPETVRDWFVYPHRVRQYVSLDNIEELKHPGGTDTLAGTLKAAALNIGPRGRWTVQAGLRPHGFDPTYVSPGDP